MLTKKNLSKNLFRNRRATLSTLVQSFPILKELRFSISFLTSVGDKREIEDKSFFRRLQLSVITTRHFKLSFSHSQKPVQCPPSMLSDMMAVGVSNTRITAHNT
jgi:hypothetical protein